VSGGEKSSDKRARTGNDARGFSALRHKDFLVFYVAKFFCVGSYHMLLVAVGYQIYDLTSDPLSLAMVNLAMIIPVFGFALVVGYIADTFDRRKVLLACYWGFAVMAALLCIFTELALRSLWPFYMALFGIGICRAFFGPTTNAIVPNLVPKEVFPNAVAWNTSAGKMAQICGPVAGGFIYLFGPEVVYAITATTFLCGAIASAMIRSRGAASKGGSLDLKSLLVGLTFVLEKKIILGALVLDLLAALMGGVQAMLPIFARDILEVGASGAGILRSSMALGGLVAALALTNLSLNRKAGMIMLVGTAIFGAATIVFGLSTFFPLSIVALAVVGGSEVINGNVRQTLFQIATPDSVRGRVGAVSSIAATTGTEMGGFRAGAFAAVMGAVPAVVVGGIVVVVATLFYPKVFPQLVRIERMDRDL
jgi:MFS family permease